MATTQEDLRRRLGQPSIPRQPQVQIGPVPERRVATTQRRTATGAPVTAQPAQQRSVGVPTRTGGFAPFSGGIPVERYLDTAGQITQVTPETTLRGTQILPRSTGAIPAVTQAAENVVTSAGAIPAFQGIATPSAVPIGQDVAQARGLTSQALTTAANLPSREELASRTFQNLIDQASEQRQLGTRAIGQDAARLGRLGSGQVTTSLGDLESAIATNLGREARGLSAETAGLTLQDALAQIGAGTGAASNLQGLDLLRAGFEQGLRGEARGERGAEREFALSDLAAQTGALGALQGLEGQRFGEEAALRGEARIERADQNRLAEQAFQNRINQLAIENALLGQAGAFGFGADPTGALLGASEQQQIGAGQSAAGSAALANAILQLYGQA